MPTQTSSIKRGLAELAKQSSARTLIDEVADALPEIEQAIAAGASYAQICKTFNDNGVPLNVTALRTYLYRLRKAAAAKAQPKRAPKIPVKSPKR